jgi:hypothetical protein
MGSGIRRRDVLRLAVSGTLAACSSGSGSGGSSGGERAGRGAATSATTATASTTAASPGPPAVAGTVTDDRGRPVPGARVTVFDEALTVFREVRTDADGRWAVTDVPAVELRVGASADGREYRESAVIVGGPTVVDAALGPDTHAGRWDVIGSTEPEAFGGTNSGSLLPDGRIFYCHNTLDPVIFDPVGGEAALGPSSGVEQGCHLPTPLLDGRVAFLGGGTVDEVGNFDGLALRIVDVFDPAAGTWERWPDLREPRWYPGMARLADGRLLLCGGGQQPTRVFTDSCEILDPATRTSTPTGRLLTASGFAPAVLLHTGEVLCTWPSPQLYDPSTGAWRRAGGFVQPDRAAVEDCPLPATPAAGRPPDQDHPDHSIVVLADGTVLAVGIRRTALVDGGSAVESYDPAADAWSLRAPLEPPRSMAEVVQLPDGSVLVAGGRAEVADGDDPVNRWCQLRRCDLYDPEADRWRRVADMSDFREYHAVSILVPDGRVVVTAGTGEPGRFTDTENTAVEAFSPPYLFRGVRPSIDALARATVANGELLVLTVSRTVGVTSVVLVGASTHSHWVDGGVQRRLLLDFEQDGDQVRAQVPASGDVAPAGWYLLFALVDDIPSDARMVLVRPGA